jgi:hypothetical protein
VLHDDYTRTIESAHVLTADTFGLDTAHSPFHLSRVMRKAKLTAPAALTALLAATSAVTRDPFGGGTITIAFTH